MSPTPRMYALACGIGAPILLIVLGTGVSLSQRASLPRPLANHWDSGGVVGTIAFVPFLTLAGLSVMFVALLGTVVALRMPRAAHPTVIGTTLAMSVLVGLSAYGILLSQRGLVDSSQVSDPSTSVLGAGVLGSIAGIVAARGYPAAGGQERVALLPAHATRLADPPSSPQFAAVSAPSGGLAVIHVTVFGFGMVVLAFLLRDWWLVVAAAIVAVGGVSILVPVVRVDDTGVHVRGFGVVPWLGVGIGEIHWASAEADPSPARGLRRRSAGPDGEAIVSYRTAKGSAIRLHLHDGTALVISCPRAETCAAVANTLVEKRVIRMSDSGDGRLTGAA